MNACCIRIVGPREHARPIWFFPYGFGIWIGRLIITLGHDTRSRIVGRK